MSPLLPPWIEALRHAFAPESAPAPVVETHISWVLLAGGFAYKIKKPVRFSFLDFSTLELRRLACEEEVRLNRRLAADLYLGVVPVCGPLTSPRLEGDGPVIEWAVKMRRFSQEDQIDRRLEAGVLAAEELEIFARDLARFHRSLPAAVDGPYGDPREVHRPVRDNFADLESLAADAGERALLAEAKAWSEVQFAELEPLLASRKRDGHIREGHGDLHLANLVRWQGRIVAFDCIEFEPALRWGDVIGDAAFLAMDLSRRGRPDLAYRFLNAYLEEDGDYEGVRVLRYYLAYRALVRAKVAMIRRSTAAGPERRVVRHAIGDHLDLVCRIVSRPKPALVLMHGLSGSGKSWLSGELAAWLPGIRLRSDVERKRMHDLPAAASSHSGIAQGLYSETASSATYGRLVHLADQVLRGGETAIVDATFLRRWQRDAFVHLAERAGVRVAFVDCRAPKSELRRRLIARASTGDASEADLAVLEHQFAQQEKLDAEERERSLIVDTGVPGDRRLAAERLRRFLAARPVRA